MFNKIKRILGFKGTLAEKDPESRGAALISDPDEPTDEEWQIAKDSLQKSGRNANFSQLGGFRPEKDNRHSSWWGGNFLGEKGETVPTCKDSGRDMHPVLQIRIDELPYPPESLKDVALLTLWFDLQATGLIKSSNGHGFEIRTYKSLSDLVPLGPGYREHETFPTFPIKWHGLEGDLPDWEAFQGAPSMVMRSDESDWFFNHPAKTRREQLQQTMPVKIGGHAQWWQSPKCVDGGDYVFFMYSTERGQFGFPAGGNGNFFRTLDSWELRVDFT